MAKNIVYIQANEKIAQSFQETFRERNIELIVAASAAEALEIMRQQDIGLLLVDINIPDMRLSQLVEICSRDFPTVIMNVCVDVMNSLLITKLVNRHSIYKIFVAPWDVREMIDEIEESLDEAAISRERILHEKSLLEKNEQFQSTLHSLTDALKNQQYSYGTIRTLTDLLLEYAAGLGAKEEGSADQKQIKYIFDTYLRMQTTEAMDAARFAKTVQSDLERISENAPGFHFSADCTVPESTVKTKIANMRFALWLLAYDAAFTRGQCDFSVTTMSDENDPAFAVFVVKITGKAEKKIPFLSRYLSEILKIVSEIACEASGEDSTSWTLTFATAAPAN